MPSNPTKRRDLPFWEGCAMTPCQGNHESTLHLMTQTPTSLFVYWELTADFLDLAKNSLDDLSPGLCLRLLREEQNGPEIVEELIFADTDVKGRMYFSVLRSYSAYFAELGLSCQSGFFTLLRSTRTLLPPEQPVHYRVDSNNIRPVSIPPSLPFAYSPAENLRQRGER